MSSARTGEREQDCWQTPENVLDLVRQVAPIDFDPWSCDGNPVAARVYRTPDCDYSQCHGYPEIPVEWPGRGLVFANPPYSRMAECSAELAEQVTRTGVRREYIALLPARTDTRWWHTLVATRPHRVCFWKGRVKFNRPDGTPGQSAPFPSALLYWGCDPVAFVRAFCKHGWIVSS